MIRNYFKNHKNKIMKSGFRKRAVISTILLTLLFVGIIIYCQQRKPVSQKNPQNPTKESQAVKKVTRANWCGFFILVDAIK
jgi:hypothetical protein